MSERSVRLLHRTLLLLATVIALRTAFRAVPFPYGDGPEYLLMGQSLANHGTPDLREADADALRRLYLKDGLRDTLRLDDLGYFSSPRDGRRYCYHFWGYSLLFTPLTWLLRATGGDELKAPQILNALLFVALLGHVAVRARLDEGQRLALNGMLFFSPAVWFILWPHPEVLSFTFVALALVDAHRGHDRLAVGEAALAAWQNPQLMILTALLWVRAALRVRARGRRTGMVLSVRLEWRRVMLAALPALVFLPHPLFFYRYFGQTSVVASELVPVSLSRAAGLLFDLNVGLLPYAPIAVLAFVALVLEAARPGRRSALTLQLAIAVILLLLANTLQSNYNHGSSGPSRYVVWLAPLLFFVCATEARGRVGAAVLALAVGVQAAIVASRGGLVPRYDYLQHSTAATFVLDRWPRLYNPDYQVFIKRTLHEEGRPTHGPYVYRDQTGACRKVLASSAHALALREACGDVPERYREFFAAGGSGHPAWTYVDY